MIKLLSYIYIQSNSQASSLPSSPFPFIIIEFILILIFEMIFIPTTWEVLKCLLTIQNKLIYQNESASFYYKIFRGWYFENIDISNLKILMNSF